MRKVVEMASSRMVSLVAILGLLSGCASFGRGVAEAVLEQNKEDTRACHIEGPSSDGLESLFREQEKMSRKGEPRRILKVLMVHGIGRHIPGYSGRFTEHLTREVGLDVREQGYKEIVLREPGAGEGPLGTLRISRYTNKERTRELLFYELTWSEITEAEKAIIEFDDSTEYTFRRASLNALLKKFLNSHVPDSLVFLGEPQVQILSSVRQSFCWMTHSNWDGYANVTDEPCDLRRRERVRHLQEDDFVIVTHSLGSRIAIDTLQYFGNLSTTTKAPQLAGLREALQGMEIRVYMLANQLPLLEMGQKRAVVRNQVGSYCRPGGEHYDQRIINRVSIFAFSDPNDILSYPIPPKFVGEYVDSRLCPSPTNITINVAESIDLFGFGEFADPAEAHGGYDHDERVISLIAHGIGNENMAQIVKDRCTWLETTEHGS